MTDDLSPPESNMGKSGSTSSLSYSPVSKKGWGLPKARTVLAVISIVSYILVTTGFFILLLFGGEMKLPEGDLGKQIIGMLGMIVGTWNSALLMVFAFHYGTSQGSTDKNEMVKNLSRRVLVDE